MGMGTHNGDAFALEIKKMVGTMPNLNMLNNLENGPFRNLENLQF